MSDGVDESLVVKVARVVLGGGVEEDIELFLGESIGLGGEDLAKVGGGDGAGVFGIENLEKADNSILLSFFITLKALPITSSESVPWSLSASMFKKTVKLIGPGASASMASMVESRQEAPRDS